MPIVRIDSADDPRLAEFQHVPDPVLLREHGLFVAEGRFAIERLVEADVFRLRAMLLTEHTLEALTPVIGAATRDTPVYVASATHFKDIGGYDFHRGYLALAERPRPRTMASLVAALPPGRPVVVLERVGNPDNVGGIFRNAAAFGAAAVLLSPGCCDPLYRKAIRTSTGATLSVPYAVVDEWPAGLATLAERGYLVAALTPDGADGGLDTLAETARGRPVALLVGAEGDGVSTGARETVDCAVRIRMEPVVDSLNVATAAGVALASLYRAVTTSAGAGRTPDTGNSRPGGR